MRLSDRIIFARLEEFLMMITSLTNTLLLITPRARKVAEKIKEILRFLRNERIRC